MILTEEQKKRTKQLEYSGYEVLGAMISKISGRTSFYLADLTKEGEILPEYSEGNLKALKFSVQLKERCKEKGWTYLKNKERLNAALDFLNSEKEEISNIEKGLLEE